MFEKYKKEIQECIDICFDSQKICLETASYCLDKFHEIQIQHLLSCAEMCNICASSILKQDKDFLRACRACAEICEGTAAICESYHDDQIQKCAEIVRVCQKSCEDVLEKIMIWKS